MSISFEIKNKILKLPLKGAKKTVLLAFSDLADKDGGSIFPSFDTLAIYIGSTREWVTKIVASLCVDGWIRKLTNYKNRPNLYCFEVQYIKEFNKKHQDEVSTEFTPVCSEFTPVCSEFTPVCSEFTVNNENHCELNSHHCELNSHHCELNSHHCELNSHKLTYNYQLTNYNMSTRINFSEKTEPIQKPELPVMEEKIPIPPEKPVEAKQQPLPSPTVEAKKKPKSKPSKVNLEEQFEQWYTAYPKHEARKKGYEAFLKAWPKFDFERLLELTKAYARSVEGKDKQFLPFPASWLNGERWKDDSIQGYCLAKTTPIQVQTASESYESPINLDSPPAQLAVADKNLNKFLEANPNLDGRFDFSGASMRKIGNEITISHPSQFSLDKMKMHSWKMKEFFKASKIEFTTETVKKPVQVWPPKPQPYTPPATELKPPRYRTLNESYHGSTAKSLGANLNALQRAYQQKLQTTG